MVKKFITTAISGSATERVMAKSITSAIRTISAEDHWQVGLQAVLKAEERGGLTDDRHLSGAGKGLDGLDSPLGSRRQGRRGQDHARLPERPSQVLEGSAPP